MIFKRVVATLLTLGTIGSFVNPNYRSTGTWDDDPARAAGFLIGRILVVVLIVWLFVSANRQARRQREEMARQTGWQPGQPGYPGDDAGPYGPVGEDPRPQQSGQQMGQDFQGLRQVPGSQTPPTR